jgi:hypothetical protein
MIGPTGVYLLGRSFKHFLDKCKGDRDLLKILEHHYIIIDEHGYHALWTNSKVTLGARLKVLNNCLIYDDAWGCTHHGRGKLWDHGPGYYNQPVVRIGGKTYLFKFDDAHARQFVGEREDQLLACPSMGLFTDDAGYKFHSTDCDQGEDALDDVWPEWRQGGHWNKRRQQFIEYMLTGICRRENKLHMINGSQRVGADTISFWEGYGTWTSKEKLFASGREGDFAHIMCLQADGSLGKPLAEVVDLIQHAWDLKMIVGISFMEYPADDRGSHRSYYETFDQWPKELQDALSK